MKKNILKSVLSLVLLVSVLVFALTGCKTFVPNNDFNLANLKDNFGATIDSNLPDRTKIVPITTEDSVLQAIQKIDANFNNYDYVASRGYVEGTTAPMKTNQRVYSTFIKERDPLGNVKVYHEDASVSNLSDIIPSTVVRIMQYIDTKGSAKINTRTIIDGVLMVPTEEEKLPYPNIDGKGEDESFTSMDAYLSDFHQDITKLHVYKLDVTTVDENASSVTEQDGFVKVNIVVLNDALQDATLERRGMVVKKTENSIAKLKSADDVTFKKLNLEVTLWPSGYLRSLAIVESYDMKPHKMGTQTCDDFKTMFYFSHDSSQLPIKEFEF